MVKPLVIFLHEAVAALPPIRLKDEDFFFSGSIAWGVWPKDNKSWDSLFEGTYKLLMNTWKEGGNKIVRYKKGNQS